MTIQVFPCVHCLKFVNISRFTLRFVCALMLNEQVLADEFHDASNALQHLFI